MIRTVKSLVHFRQWFKNHLPKIREDYFAFLRFRSISADPECKGELQRCATWLAHTIQKGGFHSELIETPGYPLVYAEDLSAGSSKPTLLIYGHYDVQPVDPIELWKSDPFEPEERDGFVYARGALDDKGQVFFALLAVIAYKQLHGALPINVKLCIEGEEESTSVGLSKALPQLKDKLSADYLLVPDFDQFDRETPAISLGCRGLVGLEVTLTGSKIDLHSGMYGGIAYNPNRALVELLSKLWDEKGRVQVPGFYDGVNELDTATKGLFAGHFTHDKYKQEAGIEAFGGEEGRTLQEVVSFQPTLELNGVCGGYCGAGLKTVIPAHASAKITCRLVPDQDPARIGRAIASFLEKRAKKGMKVSLKIYEGAKAFRTDPDSRLAQVVMTAAEEVCGKRCVRTVSGGSIPIVPELIAVSEAEMVGMGYGLGDDGIHAPNERFDLVRLEKGFLTIAKVLELL